MLRLRQSILSAGRGLRLGRTLPRPPFAPAVAVLPTRLQSSKAPAASEQFLSGTNLAYAQSMHEAWLEDPSSVHKSWQTFFELEGAGFGKGMSYVSPPAAGGSLPPATSADAGSLDLLRLERLIRSYEEHGHRVASLDPLGILDADLDSSFPPQLTPGHHGFSEADGARVMTMPPGCVLDDGKSRTLDDVMQTLTSLYCGNIGFEYEYIQSEEAKAWLRERIISGHNRSVSSAVKEEVLDGLVEAAGWEGYLQQKFPSEKRFGLDGAEALIPAINRMLVRGSELGVDSAVFGMAHRGRLNVLINVMKKPMEVVFNEFTSTLTPDSEGSGDVKYHLGMSNDITLPSGKVLHLSLMANPSHLEAVNPCVMGKARANQEYAGDVERKTVCPILIHGDAAVAGQGVVYESFGFTHLPSYTVGGTVHLVINNQVGFTTDPRFSRSTPYCTDLAKMVDAPVLHVNGDDPEALAWACELAMEWRQNFSTDVVIDMVCYRRYGHNEADQPMYTQPRLYETIGKHPTTIAMYGDKLVQEGVVTPEAVEAKNDAYQQRCATAFEEAPEYVAAPTDYYASYWKGFSKLAEGYMAKIYDTGVDLDVLHNVGTASCQWPEGFNVHGLLKRILKARQQTLDDGKGIIWSTAETLAFGSLLMEDVHVRLSGQDVERGTFSQRHHVLHDQKEDGRTFNALAELTDSKPGYSVSNSHLSEYAVLGFELGYSQTNPQALIMWEAQFGDFSNTAQCMIDQFISSGEAKWRRQAGLVMLLPHGYEGMGPEHSSARMERFLQMCSDDESVYPQMEHTARQQIQDANWQVAYPSTPANYFHLLRRQVYREFRKPLIVMTPKSLLRHPMCRSSMDEMGPGTRFRRFLPDEDVQSADDVKRLVLCTGKVYYDLLQERESRGITDVAIARVEQISPFPFDLVHRHADDFPNADIVWCQEEPKNMGAWSYVAPRIRTSLGETSHHGGEEAMYVGRKPSDSVATGDKMAHKKEQATLVDEALTV